MATSDTPSRSFDNDGQTMDDTRTSKSPETFDNESTSRLVGEEGNHTTTPTAETPLHVFLRDLGKDIDDPEDRLKLLDILEKSPRDIDTRSLERPCQTPLRIAIDNDYFCIFCLLLEKGADVNAVDEDGDYPLFRAVLWPNSKFLEPLLDYGAQSNDPRSNGLYLLHELNCYLQDERAMLRLLERHRHLLNTQDSQESSLFTPLNVAAYWGRKTMVDVLLKQGADLGIPDADGWTPLMTAVKQSHFEIFDCLVDHLFEPEREDTAKDVISRNDNEGQSVLMAFCESDSTGEAIESSLDTFLTKILNLDKFTPLDFSKTSDYEGLLDFARSSTKRFKSKIVDDFGLAVFERVPNKTVLRRFKEDTNFRDEVLCWLACQKERHRVAISILQEMVAREQIADPDKHGWKLAHWAIYHRLPTVLLRCPSLTSEDKSRGQRIISELKTSRKPKEPQPSVTDDLKEVNQDNQRNRGREDHTDTQDRVLDAMKDILDFIGLETTLRAKEPLRITRPNEEIRDCLNEFKASIVEVRQNDDEFSMGTRFRGVYDTIYDEKESFTTIRDAMEQFQKSTGKQTTGSQMPGKGITWVHLPSANMGWMMDTIKKIYVSRPSKLEDWDQVASFLRASWSQIPDKTSPSRFMRPQYAILNSKERTSKDNDDCSPGVERIGSLASALYMPFVVADYKRHEPNNNMKDSQDIVDDYYKSRGSVIHDAPTLDEHYYHFARDKESQRDQAYRNKNQVFTKYLHPGTIDEPWRLLRISQLWAWTIGDEWLVTSASCAKIDNERASTFVNAIVDHLRGQVEDGSRERGPNSATELSKVISDYCIGTYDRQQEIQESKSEKKKNGNQQSLTKDTSKDDASTDISGSTARHESKTSEISIRHIFSNFINRIGRQEAELYGQFSGQTRDLKQEAVDNSSSHGNLSTTEAAVKQAAQLLFEIKDVRDELNILRTIAEFQRKVQSRMNGRELTATSPILDEDLTAVYVRNDIDEMDKLAGRIKDALHTTITLYESEISLDQGKRVMMFTVITAWFLPASFLTSLFALDVASFLQAPVWSLLITLLVPCLVLGLAGGYMYYGRHIKDVANSLTIPRKKPAEDVSTGHRKNLGDLTVGSASAVNTRRIRLWQTLPAMRHRGSRHNLNGTEAQV